MAGPAASLRGHRPRPATLGLLAAGLAVLVLVVSPLLESVHVPARVVYQVILHEVTSCALFQLA